MSGAVQIFSRALNVSEAELFKMMEQGQLVSSEVLPKVAAELKKAALEGGAFDKALQGLRVTEGQMITETQRAGDTIFKSGFSEGLSNLYKTISEILKTSGPQLEKLGKIFGVVFNGIAYSLKVLEPVMKVAIDNFELIFGALAISKINTFVRTMQGAALATNLALAKAFLPITLAYAAAEELVSLFSDKLVGNLEESLGSQFNLRDFSTSEIITKKDGSIYKGSSGGTVAGKVGKSQGGVDDYLAPSRFWKAFLLQAATAFSDNVSFFSDSSNPAVVQGIPATSQGGNTYIFNNSSADAMKQIMGYVGATSGMSTTK